jgi:two-component system chemotaxis response regulator CheB
VTYPWRQSTKPLFPAASFDVVAVVGSAGGGDVLAELLATLEEQRAPIVVALHARHHSPLLLASLLQRRARARISYAEQGEPLAAGRVYLAPPDHHLTVTDRGTCVLSATERVNFARPSADLLLCSVAHAFGQRSLGIVLSGRLHDGAQGAAAIRAAGGTVLVQDLDTCLAADMPAAAIAAGASHFVLPPVALSSAISALVGVPGFAAVLGLGRRAAA